MFRSVTMFIGHADIFIFFRILTFLKTDRFRDDVAEKQQNNKPYL